MLPVDKSQKNDAVETAVFRSTMLSCRSAVFAILKLRSPLAESCMIVCDNFVSSISCRQVADDNRKPECFGKVLGKVGFRAGLTTWRSMRAF